MSVSMTYTDRRGRTVRPKARVAVWNGKADTSPVMAMTHSTILTKSADGKDAAGDPLASYQPRYARDAAKLTPNLSRTGTMLATLKVKSSKTSGFIHPTVPYAALINWGSAAKGYPRREFMGINSDDVKRITKEVDRRVLRNTRTSLGARRAFGRRGLV